MTDEGRAALSDLVEAIERLLGVEEEQSASLEAVRERADSMEAGFFDFLDRKQAGEATQFVRPSLPSLEQLHSENQATSAKSRAWKTTQLDAWAALIRANADPGLRGPVQRISGLLRELELLPLEDDRGEFPTALLPDAAQNPEAWKENRLEMMRGFMERMREHHAEAAQRLDTKRRRQDQLLRALLDEAREALSG